MLWQQEPQRVEENIQRLQAISIRMRRCLYRLEHPYGSLEEKLLKKTIFSNYLEMRSLMGADTAERMLKSLRERAKC